MLGFRPRLLAFALVTSAPLAAACTGAPSEPRVLGEVPTAVTTAVPEWLPRRVRSGTAFADDPREARLSEVRRLTSGFDVDALAFAQGIDALVLVGRAPGEPDASVTLLDLVSGKTRSAAGPERVFGVSSSADGEDVLVVTSSEQGSRLEELSVARTADSIFGVPTTEGTFSNGDLVLSRAALAPDGEQAFVVARASKTSGPDLYALSRGGDAPGAPIVTGVAEVTPAVSPDRAYVSYVRPAAPGSTEQSLVVASVEGRSPRAVAGQARFASVAFHPADGTLVYGSDRDAAAFELYAAPASAEPNHAAERLTFLGAKAVAFSPDGRVIAFTSRRAGATHDVFVARYRSDR